jgi:hypothetical protein
MDRYPPAQLTTTAAWRSSESRASTNTASGISRAPGSVPNAVTPGLRTSTSCTLGTSPASSASCSMVTRELASTRSARSMKNRWVSAR